MPVEHSFDLKNDKPVYQNLRRLSPTHNAIVKAEVGRMLWAGVIRPMSSEWSFPVVIGTKKDAKPRFCVEYRLLNHRMKADRCSIQKPQEIFDEMKGSKHLPSLNIFTGYWQFPMPPRCGEMATLVRKFGTYGFNVVPFRLMNEPSIQRPNEG